MAPMPARKGPSTATQRSHPRISVLFAWGRPVGVCSRSAAARGRRQLRRAWGSSVLKMSMPSASCGARVCGVMVEYAGAARFNRIACKASNETSCSLPPSLLCEQTWGESSNEAANISTLQLLLTQGTASCRPRSSSICEGSPNSSVAASHVWPPLRIHLLKKRSSLSFGGQKEHLINLLPTNKSSSSSGLRKT